MANENHKPVIAILGGTGAQGSAPALRWANAGYSIVIGSRSSQKAIEVCKRISAAVKHANVSYEDNQIAAEKGDVVVLSALRPSLQILRGVKSHRDTFLKGTAPKTNPKTPNSRRANPSTLHKVPMKR